MRPNVLNTLEAFNFMRNKKFFTEYPEEILKSLFEGEERNIKIRLRSEQLAIRPMLVDLMQRYSKRQEYSQTTLHLAVHILDVFMDNYILPDDEDHQKLIALVSLLLAAKSEERNEHVPSIKDVLKIVDLSEFLNGVELRFKSDLEPSIVRISYSHFALMYRKLEFLVFACLAFNVIRPTAASFLQIYHCVVVTDEDVANLNSEGGHETLGDLQVTVSGHLKQLMDIAILDTDFFNVVPSQLAAAVIGATRKLLKIQNYWNERLTQLTRCNVDVISNLIILLEDKCFNNVDMEDSGFLSPTFASETDDEEEAVPELNESLTFSTFAIEIQPKVSANESLIVESAGKLTAKQEVLKPEVLKGKRLFDDGNEESESQPRKKYKSGDEAPEGQYGKGSAEHQQQETPAGDSSVAAVVAGKKVEKPSKKAGKEVAATEARRSTRKRSCKQLFEAKDDFKPDRIKVPRRFSA